MEYTTTPLSSIIISLIIWWDSLQELTIDQNILNCSLLFINILLVLTLLHLQQVLIKMDKEISYEILPENSNQSNDLSFKMIIIGDSGVGKSSLTIKAIKNQFQEVYTSTVGFEFYTFNIKVNDKIIKLQIWDTCGQEIYRSLINSFYRNASLAILIYSIDK